MHSARFLEKDVCGIIPRIVVSSLLVSLLHRGEKSCCALNLKKACALPLPVSVLAYKRKKTGYRTSAFHHEFNLENSIREQKSSPWGFSCVMVCGNRCTSEIYRAVVLSDAGAGVGRGTYVKIKSLGGVTM